ncbi:PEP/pyruvate-binding domain-containing protein [Evansella cellulosilytica]|uniref:Pyruvate phosphate dikinase PEP/pyruvate-binding protein n=1 Tax=Evansella cellulosilytica (strain ATCC 21833 / DSM 2522 / FERM P-1141 / JCM 9156 / N-4) TaxID=649639 RepID=E6U0R0_EVAC2|nr:PEP/pyruvate-binding domain-containing protein [Evansella cellulosilytica]ADU29108.1 pyruvate phosphate dikinase PEP/pyruvate-binding protein [Evansella cellulosilytica DSM 2522]
MDLHEKVSTGVSGLDHVIDRLRLGDNVVWQVDSVEDYKEVVRPYVKQAKLDNRKMVYVRFGKHEPIFEEADGVKIYYLEANKGFESFATEIHRLMEQEGRKAFYVFDCLTDLLQYWHSDLMIGNFFNVTCPYLYELDTIAYFGIIRNAHTYNTIARIRETTQLLLDLYKINGNIYVHPLKVWQRYSPTMFFPHLIKGDEAISITSSAESAMLFSHIHRGEERLDHRDVIFSKAREKLQLPLKEQEETKKKLMTMLIGHESRMLKLCNEYFTLFDLVQIASREVGTGYIGGKSVGMLLARKIVEKDGGERFQPYIEPHDSFYLGSDIFYTYIVQNGWWKLRKKQRTKSGYYTYAAELKEKMLYGKFPSNIQEQFVQTLEYFGQSPIIVRSSSLLEDNFGNAFSGKYESVFCANQGTLEERYEAFENAIRTVYASTMSEDALTYRMNRGLFEKDEQMAVLVQRVSGDHYDDLFFPHLAGVGNSSNLYVWDKNIDMDAGMLRLVFGLGTRAVDRTVEDYAKIVTLDNPLRLPMIHMEDKQKFSQHHVDVLSLSENELTTRKWDDVSEIDFNISKGLFATFDYEMESRLRELGYRDRKVPYILDFEKLFKTTQFTSVMKDMLALLSKVYDYPVDIEFTANFTSDTEFKVNLVQCRPLQTRGLGHSVKLPELTDKQDCFIATNGNFMGGNVHLSIDYVVYVNGDTYLERNEQGKHEVARQIGKINNELKGKNIMLVGPGRWGTTTASLGVPVHFRELSHMAVICEVSSSGLMPELSYGSHFFQDLVETGIFYVAIFNERDDVVFQPGHILKKKNMLTSIISDSEKFSDVIHIAKTEGMQLYSDIVTQQLLCRER